MKKLNEKGSIHFIPLLLVALFLGFAVLNVSVQSEGSLKFPSAVLGDSEENDSGHSGDVVEAKDSSETDSNDDAMEGNDDATREQNQEMEKEDASGESSLIMNRNQEETQNQEGSEDEALGEQERNRIQEENQYHEMNFLGNTGTESTYQAKRRVKLFGLINTFLNEEITVSNDTGEVLQTKKNLLAKIIDLLSF